MISALENDPALWTGPGKLEPKRGAAHKYDYGHALVLAGPVMAGAAILAGRSVMRIGAGLCTIAAPPGSAQALRTAVLAAAPHLIVQEIAGFSEFGGFLRDDPRRNAVLIGPGAGLDDLSGLRMAIRETVAQGRALVVDGDGLRALAGNFELLHAGTVASVPVLTPHDGEFSALFPDLALDEDGVRAAAERARAVVLLKGALTRIAHPDGRLWLNVARAPGLATAGSGDVLAGIISGLLARGLLPEDAACAGAWIHAQAARPAGEGLVASDLPDRLPNVLAGLSTL